MTEGGTDGIPKNLCCFDCVGWWAFLVVFLSPKENEMSENVHHVNFHTSGAS